MPEPDEALYGQYALVESSAGFSAPQRWTSRQCEGWTLLSHPLVPVVELAHDEGSKLAGWIIGWAIDSNGIVRESPKLAGKEIFAELEAWLSSLSGRFAAVLFGASGARLYLDASGSLATVFSSARRIAGSTGSAISLVNGDAEAFRQAGLARPRLGANQFHPGTMTGEPGTHRLLPNHFLDLGTFEPHRHWPTAPIEVVSEAEAAQGAAQVAKNTRHCIESLAARYQLCAGLSAGRDSRMLLACAKHVQDRGEYVTFNYKDPDKFADVHMARELARRYRLNHRVLDLIDPPEQMKQEYLFRVGFTNNAGKTCDFYDACFRLIDMKRAWLVGYGGEVGRAYYWKPDDRDRRGSDLSGEELLNRMHLSVDPQRTAAMESWLQGLPKGMTACGLLDLMYLELRLGCWASPQIYGAAPFAANIMPLSCRENYARMMAMPPEYRMQQRLAHDVITREWPELLDLPFQQLTGWRQFARKLKRRLLKRFAGKTK